MSIFLPLHTSLIIGTEEPSWRLAADPRERVRRSPCSQLKLPQRTNPIVETKTFIIQDQTNDQIQKQFSEIE